MLKLLSVFSLLVAGSAHAYPQTIYKGYQSCATCHVSPAGAGLLHDYGRGVSEAFMATWSREGEAMEFFGLGETPHLDLGADVIYAGLNRRTQESSSFSRFPMLAEVELAARVDERLTLVASTGVYSREKNLENRRSYLYYKVNRHLGFRAGHFFIPYGLGLNDHTAWVKSLLGFDQGEETWNAELSYLDRWGEIFFTASSGKEARLDGSRQGRYQFENYDDRAWAVRAAANLGKRWQVGLSGRVRSTRRTWGLFMKGSPVKNTYVLAEVDHDKSDGAEQQMMSYLRGGWYIVPGFDLFITNEMWRKFEHSQAWATGFDWMVRPRIQFTVFAKASWYRQEQITTDLMMMTHLWL